MSTLPDTIRPRVAQLVRMFGSPHDGEALGAVRAIGRTLAANGGSFGDLAEMIERGPAVRIVFRDRPEPPPRVHPAWGNSGPGIVKMKLERVLQGDALSPWERDFAASIVGQMAASWTWKPTPKQEARLDALMAKLNAAGAWA